MKKLIGGQAAGICNISAKVLNSGDEAMVLGLHAVLSTVLQSGTVPLDREMELVVPIWKGSNYRGIILISVPAKVLTHLLLIRIRSHMLKFWRPEHYSVRRTCNRSDARTVCCLQEKRQTVNSMYSF